MKRGKKLLTLLAVLVLICGAALAAQRLNPENNQAEEEKAAVQVFSLDPETITSLTWTYNEGDTLSFDYADGAWSYTADAAFPLDESYLADMADALTEIIAERTIEEPEDLAEYGLHRPVCSITVTTGDTTAELSIGDVTAVDGLQYFANGDGKVYLIDTEVLSPFTYDLLEMVQLETIPSLQMLTGMSLTTANQQLELTYMEDSGLAYSDSYVWFLANGDSYRTLDTELTADYLENITSIYWNQCVSYNASDEELAEFGLDTPAAAVSIGYVQEIQIATGETDDEGAAIYETSYLPQTFDLELGRANGTTYARISGSRMVYSVNDTFLNLLLYTTYAELKPDEVLVMDWETVDSITVTLDGVDYEIIKSTQDVTDDEGNVTTETIYTLNGETVAFENVLDTLDSLESTGYAASTEEAAEEIRFTFHRNTEAFSEVTIVFFRYDSTSCLVSLDGVPTVSLDREDVVDLVEAVNKIILQ